MVRSVPKYLSRIPELGLDNTALYSHVAVARKIGVLGFGVDQKSQNAIRQALARADDTMKRGEQHPGWQFKKLASGFFDDWPSVWAEIQADMSKHDEVPPPENKPVPFVTALGILEVVAILCLSFGLAYLRYRTEPTSIPLSQLEIEEQYTGSPGAARHAAFYEMESEAENADYLALSTWISLRIIPR